MKFLLKSTRRRQTHSGPNSSLKQFLLNIWLHFVLKKRKASSAVKFMNQPKFTKQKVQNVKKLFTGVNSQEILNHLEFWFKRSNNQHHKLQRKFPFKLKSKLLGFPIFVVEIVKLVENVFCFYAFLFSPALLCFLFWKEEKSIFPGGSCLRMAHAAYTQTIGNWF